MGLDRDDQIIRNRLAQKMEAVATDLGALMAPPDDARLEAFYEERADLFSLPAAVAFRQVLFIDGAAEDAARIQATLDDLRGGGGVPDDLRSAGMLPLDWASTPLPAVNNAFGGDFAAALPALPVGEWSGPVRSGFGLHLVRVEAIAPAGPPPFEDVRDYVARQYEYYAALEAQARMAEELMRKYTIRIEAEGVPDTVRAGLAKP